MKNAPTKIAAMLLVMWYSLSVIGFNVHTCSESGETFIATVIGGTECEDIHPEHQENGCTCCHHKHHDSDPMTKTLRARSCCTDSWKMIQLTGIRVCDERADSDLQLSLCHNAAVLPAYDIYHSTVISIGFNAFCIHSPRDVVPMDFHKIYGVWRI